MLLKFLFFSPTYKDNSKVHLSKLGIALPRAEVELPGTHTPALFHRGQKQFSVF